MIKFPLPFKTRQPEKPGSVLGLRRLNSKKSKKISRKRILIFLTSIILVLLIFGIFFLITKNPFQIKNVVFKNADLSCISNEQLKNDLKLTDYHFFNLDQKKIEQRIKEKFSCISFVNFKRKIPSTLEVNLNDRKIAAQVRVYQIPESQLNLEEATSSTQAAQIIDSVSQAKEAGLFKVDTEGVVVNLQMDMTGLPVIDYYNQGGEIKLGTKLPGDVVPRTLQILTGLNEQSISFEGLKIIDSGLYIKGEKELIFSLNETESPAFGRKETERQLAYLQLILRQATIDAKQVIRVDLRFDKAIVVYK